MGKLRYFDGILRYFPR